MVRTRAGFSFAFLVYVVVGVVVAWRHTYITTSLLKAILSGLLAVFLWFLVLLGVNLHV